MQKAIKVYGFGTAFYNELQSYQKKQIRYFISMLIFFAVGMFLMIWLIPPLFLSNKYNLSFLQIRILGTALFVCVIIWFTYLYDTFVIQRNTVIDIEEWDDDRDKIEAKVADFRFVQALHLRWITYQAHVVLQFQYKKRPLRVKVIMPIITLPKFVKDTLIYDPLMKNMDFLMGLVTKMPENTLSDTEKKHLLHKRIPHILSIQKRVNVYMDTRNQSNPYVDISMSEFFATDNSLWYMILFDKIRKVCLFVCNCVFIFYAIKFFFRILMWILILLNRI